MTTDLFRQPDPTLLHCTKCSAPIDLHALFVRDGVCADCEWPE